MRALALLLLALAGLAVCQNAEIDQFLLEDMALSEKLLEQAKEDALSDSPFHAFPQVSKRSKRDTNCPAGYTGTYCESPICDKRVDIVGHQIKDTYIEKKVVTRCAEPVTVYIDSHLNFVKISVYGNSRNARPGGQLYNATMVKVDPTSESSVGSSHVYNYVGLVAAFGTGAYTFAPRSASDDDCTVTASATTPLVVYGGFVASPFDDNVQQDIPDGYSVQTDPLQLAPSYFAFRTVNVTANDDPKWVSFHRGNDTYQAFAPLPVLPRYNCEANKYVGPYVCTDDGTYILKIRGLDDSGTVWQRAYTFECVPNPDVGPPEPSPSGPPVLECENGGQLINQGDKNVCYCGAHFSGPTCTEKVCDHEATLNLQGECECKDGYSGQFCEHIHCSERAENFNLNTRGLTFVVRANKNEAVFTQFKQSVNKILSYYNENFSGVFEEYSLILIVNGETVALRTMPKQQQLLDEIEATKILWQVANDCADKVFLGLDEALGLTTTIKYLKGPVFLFTDAISNDDASTAADLGGRLGAFKSPVFTIFYGGGTDTCNENTDTSDYGRFRRLAQYTHGLTVKVSADGDSISDAASSLAIGFFNTNLLAAHDLLDSCQYAPAYHIFFVDDSVSTVVTASTGPTALKLRVLDTNGNKVDSDNGDKIYGDLKLASYSNLPKGHYRLVVDSNGLNSPCTYRVYAQSNYEAFFAASNSLDTDRSFFQPIYNYDLHLVGTITGVDFPDPENLFAEVVIWQENDNTIGNDRREVVYASSGIYRDDCSYNLYFGPWTCTDRSRIYYVQMYVTDADGYTVMRTTTAQCATNSGPPDRGCRNGGVSYQNKCLCTAGWTGKDCRTADCYNGGKSNGDHCICTAGYGGEHCQLFSCPDQNTKVSFQPKGITVSLIVQKSKDMLNALIGMRDITSTIIQNLKSAHKEWLSYYTYWEFDDKNFQYLTKTPFPENLGQEVKDMIEDRRAAPMICKDLKVLEVLIAALSDPDASNDMIVYLYIYGGLTINPQKQGQLFELIDQLGAKINIIQSASSSLCFNQDFGDKHLATLVGIAAYSGGTFSVSGLGTSLLALPLQYSAGTVYNEMKESCQGTQTFYFPIASETQTIALYITGEVQGAPTFNAPDGSSTDPLKVYVSPLDQLYVAMRECPDGWAKKGDHCFRMDSANGQGQVRSWTDAKTACVASGGTLAMVNNKDLNDYLVSLTVKGVDVWIGLNDMKKKGSFVWDQGMGTDLKYNTGDYNAFKSGEPNLDAGQCVALSTTGWYVTDCTKKLSYVCSQHVYDVNYDPNDSRDGHLPRGLWSVSFNIFESDDAQACGLRVDVQSALQVARRFTTNPFLDDGEGQAVYQFNNNHQIVHVGSSIQSSSDRSSLEYAHFYPSNDPSNLALVTRMTPRDHCTYEYISDHFTPDLYGYQVGYTGFDSYGYPYQRILPTVAFDSTVQCANGGVQSPTENRCVCPPAYGGKECREPVCISGVLAANDIKCKCLPGFVGDNCEKPNCLRGTGIDPPPIVNSDKTFALIIDGSFTGYNQKFLTNFKSILDKTFSDLTSAVENAWFKNYVGIVAYDPKHKGGITSKQVISARGRADFEDAIVKELQENYKAPADQTGRAFINALMKVLDSKDFAVGSPVYIVTDSAISDPKKFDETLYNLIAKKHAIISTIILGDTKVPGGKQTYRDASVRPYLEISTNTGGGFYQVADSDNLAGFWTGQLGSYFSSIGLVHSIYFKCTDRIDYFQIGGEDTNVIVDVFSPQPQVMNVYDPDNQTVVPSNMRSSKTNFLFTKTADKPGIWRIEISHTDKTDFCIVAVRAVRTDAPSVGFNTDVGLDRGLHSQGAQYAPEANKNNAIIAYSKKDYLRAVQIFTHDTGSLVFTSPLIKRTEECTWNYSSKYVFKCPATSFTVAIEGSDPNGHQFRRLYKTHCLNYDTVSTQVNAQLGQNLTQVIGFSN